MLIRVTKLHLSSYSASFLLHSRKLSLSISSNSVAVVFSSHEGLQTKRKNLSISRQQNNGSSFCLPYVTCLARNNDLLYNQIISVTMKIKIIKLQKFGNLGRVSNS